MKIVVTGASGYIGTELCRRLSADASVAEIVNVDVAAPRGDLPGRRTVLRDVSQSLDDLCAGADVAIHLAWVLNPLKDAARMTRVNLGGTRQFLGACARAGVRRLLLASSAREHRNFERAVAAASRAGAGARGRGGEGARGAEPDGLEARERHLHDPQQRIGRDQARDRERGVPREHGREAPGGALQPSAWRGRRDGHRRGQREGRLRPDAGA